VADQGQELLGHRIARHRPQSCAGAARKQHRNNEWIGQKNPPLTRMQDCYRPQRLTDKSRPRAARQTGLVAQKPGKNPASFAGISRAAIRVP
jgi:hypothetical protein